MQIWPIHSHGPCEEKPIKNFAEKGAWQYPGTVQFFEYPHLSQEWVKLRISNFVPHSWDRSEQKHIKISATVAAGVLIYRAHRAVIFVVAQLSCMY